jgi:SAM-dependent methyltransferase
MPIDHFAGDVAVSYDSTGTLEFVAEQIDRTVDLLADLAGAGRVLEFGIGTGRVALPLHGRGITVVGVDLSPDMIAQLRVKANGDQLDVVTGDFACTRVSGAFALVYLVFNTIANLTTQDEQVACFRNASAHLTEGGRFVIELQVPDLQRLPFGETLRPFASAPGYLGVDEYDVVRQGLVSHHHHFGTHPRTESMPFRYAWPAELDLMARLAGMALEHRWGDWDRSPFTAVSTKHISVWRKVADGPF